MIVYPVKIYRPNEFGELEYIETIYPDQLSEIHWDKFNRDTGQLNLRSKRKYTRVDSNMDRRKNSQSRGYVPWDEPYERRHSNYKYKK